MERGQVFKGRYHVLGGTLSALDAIGPDELGIPRLIGRVTDESIREVILFPTLRPEAGLTEDDFT